jgi:hypothetical protein
VLLFRPLANNLVKTHPPGTVANQSSALANNAKAKIQGNFLQTLIKLQRCTVEKSEETSREPRYDLVRSLAQRATAVRSIARLTANRWVGSARGRRAGYPTLCVSPGARFD